jgi:hypothetical protein
VGSFSLLLLVFLIAADRQDKTAQGFVLNDAKPYVYITFDHAGKRKPLGPNESTQGLWLRLVNNCRVPVTIGTFGTGSDEPGIGVFHEVVPIPKAGSHGIPGPADETSSERARNPPEGYYAEVGSSMTVAPGESVLFSVPLNHLTRAWYLRVRFTLAVSPSKVGDQPYSYADFRWEQLPEDVRRRKK